MAIPSALDQPIPVEAGKEEFPFRICQVTGLRVDRRAERLIVLNATTAVVFLLLGGVAALFLSMTRWTVVGLLSHSPELFYRILTFHGMNMLVYWIIFFEVGGLYFGGTVLLNARLPRPRLGWLAYAMMLGGAVMTDLEILSGRADVMYTSYVPLQAPPPFYLGTVLFLLGALLAVVLFFAALFVAHAEHRYQGSLPLVTYGLATAAILATSSILGGLYTYVPTFFWSLGWMHQNPQAYRLDWWLMGHGTQQVNLAAMVAIWYLLAYITVGARAINERFSRTAFVLYILTIQLGSVHHLLVDPGLTRTFKIWTTSYAMYAAVLGSMMHAFSIPAGIEAAQRAKGFTKGIFGWLVKAPWKEPGFSALVLSMVIFGFLGGTTGVAFGHEQVSMLHHNTLAIPGHFHETVVAGTTLAFMGATYYLLPLVFRRKVVGMRLARVQPYLFGVGVALLGLGMMGAGGFGVPRRVPSLSYASAPVPVHFPAAAYLSLDVMGIGAILALAGGAAYVAIAVGTLLFGERIAPSDAPVANPPLQAQEIPLEARHHVPGTLVLVFGFLAFFIVVVVGNYLRLSALWPLH